MAVARDISAENGDKFTLEALFGHRIPSENTKAYERMPESL